MNTLFIVGFGIIGFLLPEWIVALSNRAISVGIGHNILCATAFALIAAYFVQ